MSDFYNNDDIVSCVDQSKADIIDRLDEVDLRARKYSYSKLEELEKKINKIFEIVENMEANLNG